MSCVGLIRTYVTKLPTGNITDWNPQQREKPKPLFYRNSKILSKIPSILAKASSTNVSNRTII